jgi:hypothetical protein
MNLKARQIAFCIVIACVLLPLSSCKEKQSTEASGDSGVIMPLKEGNTWVFHYTFFDTLGNITSTMVDSTTIGRDTVIDGETWYRTHVSSMYHYTNRADGYYLRVQDYGANAQISRLKQYPARVNDSIPSGSTYIVVASVSDQITVGAGGFSCYQYRWNYNGYAGQPSPGYRQEWYCPNVGPVKYVGHLRTQSGRDYINFSGELNSYHLK